MRLDCSWLSPCSERVIEAFVGRAQYHSRAFSLVCGGQWIRRCNASIVIAYDARRALEYTAMLSVLEAMRGSSMLTLAIWYIYYTARPMISLEPGSAYGDSQL